MTNEAPAAGMRDTILQMVPLQLCLLVAIPFVLTFSAINFSLGLSDLGKVELLMSCSLAGLYAWSRQGGSLFWQKNLFILHPAVLFSLLFLQGGFSEIGFIWSFGFPFIACLSAGSRIGLAWTVAYACLIAFLSLDMAADYSWQKMLYIGLAYFAFSLIAIYTVLSREKHEALKEIRLEDTTFRLKREEHALLDSKFNHRSLLDSLPTAIAVHSEGKWIYCNYAIARLLGADSTEQIIGSSIFDYVHPDSHDLVQERIRKMTETGRPALAEEIKLMRRNGEVLTAEILSSPVVLEGQSAFMLVAEDVTARIKQELQENQLQSHLKHAQRLESLGVLAGGIAHDFNYLLAAIMSNVELAKAKAHASLPVTECLENIEHAGDHASELCKQMLAYAGKDSDKRDVLDCNSMVESMGKLIRASISSNITLKIELDSDLPGIEGDMAQMQQMLLNFIANSTDAIGKEAGEIKISTDSRFVKRDLLDLLYNGRRLPEGQYVIIEVKDSGCGMDRTMQAKIFTPFFTTKDRGSGLGLSAVLGIVRGHYGAIQLFSAPAQGTAFRAFLPAITQQAKDSEVSSMEINAWRVDGVVLIVDDDLRVRKVASALIKQLHGDVITAEDGKEGVELFGSHHRNLVAVLLDMTMPVMGGLDAMAGMREITDAVPIILLSGYNEVEADGLIAGDRPDAFLQKPFKAADLKTVLHAVLEQSAVINQG